MDYIVSNIVWDSTSKALPTLVHINWANGCMTTDEAIDLTSTLYDDVLILSCDVREE